MKLDICFKEFDFVVNLYSLNERLLNDPILQIVLNELKSCHRNLKQV